MSREVRSQKEDQRFYAVENVIRSAHLVPTKSRTEVEDGSDVVFYINNYVGWEQYNTYDADFAETGRRLADRWYVQNFEDASDLNLTKPQAESQSLSKI